MSELPCLGRCAARRKTLAKELLIGPYNFSFERRRYSNCWFCWAHVQHPQLGIWISLGSPWQAATPPYKELLREAELVIKDEYGQYWRDEYEHARQR